jgi:hypothetical protein
MSARFVPFIAFTLVLGAAIPTAGSSVLATPASAPTTPGGEDPVTGPGSAAPGEVERVVVGDMVVDWIGGAPADAAVQLASSAVPVDLSVAPDDEPDHDHDHDHDGAYEAASTDGQNGVAEHHAGASGGYALFSATARWLPGGYTIRLTGADGRIEQVRHELTEAARGASALAGVPIRVAAAFGGPVDPGRGEIAVVLGSGPCGSGAIGCGGPALSHTEVISGRVWIHPTALGLSPAHRANLVAHELGHAFGLQHYDGSWTDGRQVMHPVLAGTTSFRAGDGAGLRRLSGADERPAGTVTARTYAAGRLHVTGTVSSGSRIRLSAGSISADVAVSRGQFSGSLPLPAGPHRVCASSLDPAVGFRSGFGCGSIEAPGTPFGHLDRLQGSAATVKVRGWALDPQTAGPVQVQIRRNGALVATVRADRHRDDLGAAAHHYGTAHGFDADIIPEPGRNRVCVRILGVGAGGDASAGCHEIDHAEPAAGGLDAVPGGGDGSAVPEVPLVTVPPTVAAVVEQVLPEAVGSLTAPLP